jgi:hypothetical protein
MLKSSYAHIEASARRGSTVVIVAMLLHLTSGILSMAALGGSLIRFVLPMAIQLGLCAALFAGKGWARWTLVAFNLVGGGFLAFMLISGKFQATGFYTARAIICGVVAILLVVPPVKAYLIWKNMRF